MDRIQNFLLSVNGIKIESQLTDGGPHRPLWVCTVPNDYAMLRTNNTKTIHLNTNPVNIYYGQKLQLITVNTFKNKKLKYSELIRHD